MKLEYGRTMTDRIAEAIRNAVADCREVKRVLLNTNEWALLQEEFEAAAIDSFLREEARLRRIGHAPRDTPLRPFKDCKVLGVPVELE